MDLDAAIKLALSLFDDGRHRAALQSRDPSEVRT